MHTCGNAGQPYRNVLWCGEFGVPISFAASPSRNFKFKNRAGVEAGAEAGNADGVLIVCGGLRTLDIGCFQKAAPIKAE